MEKNFEFLILIMENIFNLIYGEYLLLNPNSKELLNNISTFQFIFCQFEIKF